MKKNLLLVVFLFLIGLTNLQAKTTHYVKTGGTGNGTSWSDAAGNIQDMIDKAVAGDEVWVAKGTYYPTKQTSETDVLSKTFLLKDGVHLYGGFSGNETDIAGRTKSDKDVNGKIDAWEFTNETILSGNTDGVEDVWTKKEISEGTNKGWYWEVSGNTGNSYRVITCQTSLTIDTRLDGFSVEGGHNTNTNQGSGIYAKGKLTIANCIVNHNMASMYTTKEGYNWSNSASGGGIYYSMGGGSSSSAVVDNCLITNNAAQSIGYSRSASGGGIYIATGRMQNCTVSDNSTNSLGAYGGGVYLSGGDSYAEAFSCIVYNNSCNASNLNIEKSTDASAKGGGIFSNVGNIRNCCITNNHISAYSDTGTTSCLGGGVYSSGTTSTRKAYIHSSTVVNNSAKNIYHSMDVSDLNIEEDWSLSQNFIRPTSFTGTASASQQRTELLQANWQLKFGSQYIDDGNTDNLPQWILNGTDLAGNPRIYNGKIDIGAYEYNGTNASEYTITASAGTGGSISPNGAVTVNENTDKLFTMTANTGYRIDSVLINDINDPAAVNSGSYTFTNITANHSIRAVFKSTTGINDIATQAVSFKVYPNPVVNEKLIISPLNLALAFSRSEASNPPKGDLAAKQFIELFDLNGKLVATYQIAGETTEINISHLSNGTYLIKVGNETVKIIKQ